MPLIRLCVRGGVQTPDSKKEQFRKYLEKSGVIDALTKGTVDVMACISRQRCCLWRVAHWV